MGIYDIQLEQTGTAIDWTLLVLCAVAGVLGLIAAVVVVPQLVNATIRARGRGDAADATPATAAQVTAARASVARDGARTRVGLAMATLLSAVLVIGGIAGVVVSLTATGVHHASGHVESTGVVDGQRWLKIAELPFAVAWNGGDLEEGARVGAECTEGSEVAALNWTCAAPAT